MQLEESLCTVEREAKKSDSQGAAISWNLANVTNAYKCTRDTRVLKNQQDMN